MARRLGKLEAAALAYTQMRSLRTVRSGELAAALRLSAKQERELLTRMARSGLIARVRRGLYLFPPRLPLGGMWTPDEAAAINALMSDRRARYQITGPGAFNRYGYDEQVPSRITLYNDALSGRRRVGSVALELIKVRSDRLGDTEEVRTPGGDTLVYSSRVRTLIDAVYDWSRFDGLPRAYDWIRRDVEAGRVAVEELVRVALRYGNTGTIRRLGALLEQMKADERILSRLQRVLKRTTAKIPFIPGRPVRGRLLKRWAVVVNG